MQHLRIRSPQPQDAEAVVAISRECYPERPEDPQAWMNAVPERYFVGADPGGEVIAYGCLRPDLYRFLDIPKYRLHLAVRRDRRGQGAGRRMYLALEQALAALRATDVRVRVRDSETDALAFLERRGYVERQRMLALALNVAEALRPACPDVEILTLKQELERRPDCLEAVHALHNAFSADIPTADPTPPLGFEEFGRQLQDPNMPPDAFFLAIVGDRYAGYSNLGTLPDQPHVLGQRITGVHPDFRRCGIALALKARTIEYARTHGYTRIVTNTNAENTGMQAVNFAFGFTVQFAEIRLGKALGGTASHAQV